MQIEAPESAGMNGDRLKRIDRSMLAYVERGTFAGVEHADRAPRQGRACRTIRLA